MDSPAEDGYTVLNKMEIWSWQLSRWWFGTCGHCLF